MSRFPVFYHILSGYASPNYFPANNASEFSTPLDKPHKLHGVRLSGALIGWYGKCVHCNETDKGLYTGAIHTNAVLLIYICDDEVGLLMSLHIGSFEEGTETWELYRRRLEQYFVASDTSRLKRKYEQFCWILSGRKPSADFQLNGSGDTIRREICTIWSSIVQRYQFYTKQCKLEEKVADFLANLRELARGCNRYHANRKAARPPGSRHQ